jgi:hypothetical protein
MHKVKLKERLSVVEAMDALASLAEITCRSSESLEKSATHSQTWTDCEQITHNEDLLLSVFDSLHHYLEHIHAEDVTQIQSPQIRAGVEAISCILQEAIEKLKRFTSLFKNGLPLECQRLQEYLRSIAASHKLPSINRHHEEVEEVSSEESFKDLEECKEDLQYELFYLKNEDRKPFYTSQCIKRLKMLYDSELLEKSDSALSKASFLLCKDFQKKAIAILVGVHSVAREFYKSASLDRDNSWALALNKSLMALMLASNPEHLMSKENTVKTSSEYFADFKQYLRDAVTSSEYKQARLGKIDGQDKKLLLLTYKLCSCYFLSVSLQKEVTTLLKTMITKNEEKGAVFEEVALEDGALRQALRSSPNGPIKKIVEAFLQGDIERGWDPLMATNGTERVFSLKTEEKEIPVLRMAAPLFQTSIRKAEVVKEFEAWINPCLKDKKTNVLLIDLQDSTSRLEYARAEALKELFEENLDKKLFTLLRLAKKTDFYLQRDLYQEEGDAESFMNLLQMQIQEGELCGFWIPSAYMNQAISIASSLCSMIHEVFFRKKGELSCRQRQDFIEIFYSFFILQFIEWINPDCVIFLSKDGLDTAVSSIASFFFSLKNLLVAEKLSFLDRDFLLWVLYGPTLLIRERALHKQEALRTIHFLESFELGDKKRLLSWYKKVRAKDVKIIDVIT